MKDIIEQLAEWRKNNENIAITTVVETWGSAPRPVGSKMATTQSGRIVGSVSAGCVEGAVIEESEIVMKTGEPRLIEFGVADETAWSVGLACGGRIKVFIEPGSSYDSIFGTALKDIESGIPFFTITYLDGPENNINKKLLVEKGGAQVGDLPRSKVGDQLFIEASDLLDKGKSAIIEGPNRESIFIDSQPLPPQLIVIGAVHLAVPLTEIADTIGFNTILIDPRKAFASHERFPHVAQLVQEWPDEGMKNLSLDNSAYIVVLTHDPKLDDPALMHALRSHARYVGALGSQRTNQKRIKRLKKAGLTDEELARLHAPIGMDLGGRSANEIAISIMAEIVKVKNEGAE